MKDSEVQAIPGSTDPAPRLPYTAPRLMRLGSIAEVTKSNPTVGADDDSEYGPDTTAS
jgi:hypothetical protein